jgi:EAL domain-containing protein (putative c-di-GMP-specific phosphodiesterase class I)
LEWQKNKEAFTLSVNVSAREFVNPDFRKNIEKLLFTYNFNPEKMIIEITEDTFLDNFESCIDTIKQLKKQGFSFSIDDFGTGYSSLSYLQKIPADFLKIDREFITNIEKEEKKHIIVESTIKVSHKLGFKTICEGVETEDEFNVIKNLGSDYVQGYLFGKPQPI